MRGISTIIELLLILLVLTSLATLFWMFTSGTIKELTLSGTQRTEKTREILSTCMVVDSANGNNIYIKNCGDGVIVNKSLGVFLDGERIEFNMTPESIKKGEIGIITTKLLGLNIGDHEIKMSSPGLQITQKIEATLPDSAVLAYDFDEGPPIVYDKSVNENNGIPKNFNGTLYGNTHWVEGRFGYGLEFDGDGDYMLLNEGGGFNDMPLFPNNPNNGPVTITLWFKTSDVAPSETKYLFSDNYDEIAFRLLTSGKLQAETYSSVNSLQPITANEWHFAALSYDYNNRRMYFYLDGNLQGSTSVSLSGVNGFEDYPFGIGVDYQGGGLEGPFNGIIDEVRIFNKALSQSEIQTEMQSSTPVSSQLIWSFEEPSDMWVKGKYGNAMKFDGLNDYVNVGDIPHYFGGQITIEALIKRASIIDTNKWEGVVSKWSGEFYIGVYRGKYSYYLNDGVSPYFGVDTNVNVPINEWHHIMLTNNGTTMKCYADGIEIANRNGPSVIPDSSTILTIGLNSFDGYFNGTIDSVRIYNKELAPNETVNLRMK